MINVARNILSIACLSLLVATSFNATADLTQGKQLYKVCASCHGQKAQGSKRTGAPALAGQSDWYLIRQIENFKQGIRGQHAKDTFGKQMLPMLYEMTTNEAIENVVSYISSLPVRKPKKIQGNLAAGKEAYGSCGGCHGASAEGNKAVNAPKLANLQPWYIERQLENFKARIRGEQPKDLYGMQMRPMVLSLEDEQAIKDVAAYIASLAGK